MYTFVGMDYYCESAIPYKFTKTLYSNDSLWDGQQCNGNEGPCCTNPKMPWFIKTSSITNLAHGLYYSEVCGQLRGYQFRAPDGFPPLYNSNPSPNIDNCNTYVDGVTITYGSNPRRLTLVV